jgi:hypothetical protein
MTALWVLMSWGIYGEWNHNNRIHGTHNNFLQKTLIVIPVGKLCRTLAFAIYAGACPWDNHLSARYMIMTLVTISTVYQSVFIGIIILISMGWNLLRDTLSRREEFLLLLMMSAIYMSYSAYYFSFGL